MKFSSFVLAITVLLTLAFVAACSATTPTAAPVPSTAPVQATALPAEPNVPAQPTTAPAGIVTAVPSNSDAAPTGASTAAFTKINLNTATAEQILTIPNTGSRMVREFQEYRPYTTILQFRREIGKYVDAATIAGYEQYVYVPVNANQSDAATLQQIPGVSADIAAQLISARPYADDSAFLAKLTSLASGVDAGMAQNYLSQ